MPRSTTAVRTHRRGERDATYVDGQYGHGSSGYARRGSCYTTYRHTKQIDIYSEEADYVDGDRNQCADTTTICCSDETKAADPNETEAAGSVNDT